MRTSGVTPDRVEEPDDMAFQLPNRPAPLSARAEPRNPRTTAGDLFKTGQLCQPLLERVNHGRDQVAFDYLARETSLEVLNDCIRRIPDQQLTDFLIEHLLMTASLLSSEAFTGVDEIREELKELSLGVSADPKQARARYDRRVEKLGQYFFALGRRLHQLEGSMANCPLTGSAEQLRGLYGQRVRDLAGDVRFMRQERSRWVRRFVPLKRDEARADDDAEFLEGRLDAVVDELGLRLREVQDTLNATLFEQLVLIDASLKRKKLFRRDPGNVVDVGRLLDWLGNALDRAKEFDEGRRSDQLERVKTLLREFTPKEYLSFSGLRGSDQALFLRCIEDLERYQLSAEPGQDDPIKVFLLLTGDFIAGLRRQHRDSESDID